jgi:exopolyphosphatase/guanosine-5'-triphosphate,3'-diphosphate pyrophosphatase
MRIALIDCGTNTFHLLIAEVTPDKTFRFLVKEQVPVMLGEGGLARKEISDSAFNRGLNCIKNFNSIIQNANPDKVMAYGTAALRNASNAHRFIEAVKTETGIELQVIDGPREAGLIYAGVKKAVSLNGMELIMDIGGGSTELIIADEHRIYWLQSYPAGATVLREQFKPSDPVSRMDIEEMEKWFATLFSSFIEQWKGKVSVLNGSAGSFETLAALACLQQGKTLPDPAEKSGEINFEALQSVYTGLLHATREQRLQMKGLPEFRVDMIVSASILINFIIQQMGIKKIRWSAYSLKEGMLFENAGL